jgi:DMSO/TMAO reductase YedYZ molybdopterin-dependent catalytic subunit
MSPLRIEGTSRRDWLRAAAGVLASGAGFARRALAQDAANTAGPKLIVRVTRPLTLETPVEVFDRFLTPNDLFFVRSHFGAPAVDLAPWTLTVRGLVDRPLVLALEDLAKFEQVTAPAVLQCSGNGRSFYNPTIPGVGWGRGGVGNAEWSGIRLADLLGRAGLKVREGHVHMFGADAPPSIKTPVFLRSIPLARALDPGTLLATRMNGDPLPVLHGGPLRLVVPGWGGNHWLKWLRGIVVATDEAPGFYQQTGYRIAKIPAPPGADLKPSDLVPVTTMPVKSLISRPAAGDRLLTGGVDVQGVAWTGTGHVTKVEVTTGADRPWTPATLLNDERFGIWRLWRWQGEIHRPGRIQLRARATDSTGKTQPEKTPWNRSGYMWNGIDTVECEVLPRSAVLRIAGVPGG